MSLYLKSCDNFLTTNNNLQSKGQKQGGPGTGVEVSETRKNVQEQHQMNLQKGAGEQSSTVLCFPKGMHSCPRVSDNYHSC